MLYKSTQLLARCEARFDESVRLTPPMCTLTSGQLNLPAQRSWWFSLADFTKFKVQRWVNRALDMGVPRLMEEFKYSLSKWQPEGMTVNAFLANRDKNR